MFELGNLIIIITIIFVYIISPVILILAFKNRGFILKVFIPEVRKKIHNYMPYGLEDYSNNLRFYGLILLAAITGVAQGVKWTQVSGRDLYYLFSFKFVSKTRTEEMLYETFKLKQLKSLNDTKINDYIDKIISSTILINLLVMILIYYLILAALIFLVAIYTLVSSIHSV